jgi:serine/threonine-protein kinase
MVTSNVRLLRPLGEGGMGSVWLAEHLSLHTNVVVKFMAADLAKSMEAIARFSREAAAASQVKSPHVVQTLDHGVAPNGSPYIVMELLEGHDLGVHLEEHGRLAPTEVVAIVSQLARALVRAHERGIVHRDIKPSNIFLCDAGGGELFVKLLDFGIAKGADMPLLDASTRTGSFVGSPFYMSPEQVVGAKNVDAKSDLWSLGVVAFEALTGEKPFLAETVGALALAIHRDELPVPSRRAPGILPSVDAWFARACAREPSERFASAKDMADALALAVTGERAQTPISVGSRPRGKPAMALAETALMDDLRPGMLRLHADPKSETGAGVGLVAMRTTSGPRSKWLIAAAVAVVALGVGFAIPRIVGKTGEGPASGGASTNTNVSSTPTSNPTSNPTSTSTSTTPATPVTATGAALATGASTGGHAVAGVSTKATGTAKASASAGPPPLPSAVPSMPERREGFGATATATVTATAKPPGNDDDIK